MLRITRKPNRNIFMSLPKHIKQDIYFSSIMKEDIKKLSNILASGVEINKKYLNRTPLMLAVELGNLKIVEMLLKYGADPNIESLMSKKTPLMLAVEGKYVKIIHLLMKYGADINAVDGDGNNSLYYACRGFIDDTEIMEILIYYNIDINNKTRYGMTSLHYLVRNRQSELKEIKYLIDKGAKTDIKNSDGNTALDIAIREKRPKKIIDLLKKHSS